MKIEIVGISYSHKIIVNKNDLHSFSRLDKVNINYNNKYKI